MQNGIDLVVASEDRVVTGTSSSTQFRVQLKESLRVDKCITLKEIQLPLSNYIIRTGINDTIDFNNGGVQSVTVAAGQYTSASLLAAVLAAMKTVDPNFATATLSATTQTVTITNPVFTFTMLPITGPNVTRSLLPILGFITEPATAASQTGSNAMRVQLLFDMYINVDMFGTPNRTTSGSAYTFRIPISGNSGTVIQWSENENYTQRICIGSPVRLQSLNVALVYKNGEIVNLNGSDWQFVVRLE